MTDQPRSLRDLPPPSGVYRGVDRAVVSTGVRQTREASATESRIAELYAAHGAAALRLAYVHIGDLQESEDLVHDAFVRVMSRFDRTDGTPRDFERYLLRTVSNLAKNKLRSFVRGRAAARRLPVHQPTESREFMEDVLRTLPQRQRTVIFLRYHLGYPLGDVAEVLGCSVSAVKSLQHRALAELRRTVER